MNYLPLYHGFALYAADFARNQAEAGGPVGQANKAIEDPAPQISVGRAGENPERRPGGHAQISVTRGLPR